MTNEQDILQRLNDLERQVAQMVIRGVISKIDSANQLVRVTYGSSHKPMITGWLPIKPIRSGKAIVWWFPEIGEGVTVISPGDCCLGEVFPGSYHSKTPAPSDNPDLFLVEFGDGSSVSHDRKNHLLKVVNVGDIDFSTEQKIKMTAQAGFELIGDLSVSTGKFMREIAERLKLWLHPKAGDDDIHRLEAPMSPEEAAKLYELERCVECGVCVSACATKQMRDTFVGAVGLMKIARFELDSRVHVMRKTSIM